MRPTTQMKLFSCRREIFWINLRRPMPQMKLGPTGFIGESFSPMEKKVIPNSILSAWWDWYPVWSKFGCTGLVKNPTLSLGSVWSTHSEILRLGDVGAVRVTQIRKYSYCRMMRKKFIPELRQTDCVIFNYQPVILATDIDSTPQIHLSKWLSRDAWYLVGGTGWSPSFVHLVLLFLLYSNRQI